MKPLLPKKKKAAFYPKTACKGREPISGHIKYKQKLFFSPATDSTEVQGFTWLNIEK
jgi:hypothetical protein